MARSQNGLSANDRSLIASFLIPGSARKIALRKGWVSVLLLDFLGFWHNEIEPIDQGVLDDWGYAERLVRGSVTDLSNHASGSAADANALRHVLGKLASASLAQWQIDKIRARIALYRRALRWGGDYSGRKDVMHVEVDDPTNGPAVAAQIQTGWLAPGVRSYLTGAATAAAVKSASRTVEEYRPMKIIKAPNRGSALIGAGYYKQLENESEDYPAARAVWGEPIEGNDRQFDLWKAQALYGTRATG